MAAAAILVLVSFAFPLWFLHLKAPQYPETLNLYVYAYKFEGSGNPALDDIAEYDVGWTDGLLPRTSEAFFPSRTPSGRPIRLVRLGISDASELIVAIARGKIVHPTISSFAAHHGHPGVAYVPIVDLPPAVAALVWRRDGSPPALRDFVEHAQE